MKWIKFYLIVAVAGLASAIPVPASADVKQDYSKRDAEEAQLVAHDLPMMHLTHHPFDQQIASGALDLFLDSLDYDHSFFLASDIAEFQKEATNLADRVHAGDVSFAHEVYDLLKDRISNRVEYAGTLLDKGFDVSVRETYSWERKKAPWAADEKEWNELWRKKVKNQYVARLVSVQLGKEEAEAAKKEAAKEKPKAGKKTKGEKAEVEDDTQTTNSPDARLTPEEFVKKGLKQYESVLDDNDPEWVVERYLTAFAQAYDPHSDYMSANNMEDFDINMKLSLVGIGALLTTEDGAAKVERLIPGGPAEHDGRLKAGDKIIAVAQGDKPPEDILHWPLSKAVRLIRGEKNTKVVLTVIPASDPSGMTTRKIDLIRDEVKLEEQAAKSDVKEIKGSDGITHRLGVIRLPEFYADLNGRDAKNQEARSSSRDVKKLLFELRTNNVEGIILDLRNNGGGLLAEAVEMTGLFIDSGPVVQVSNGRGSQVLSDDDPDIDYKGPLVVLVNRMTASASEILAGALQDYGRAIIVGDSKTHGKGTVQTMTDLKKDDKADGSLKVTTASFYRIAGGSTQLRGIVPDIVTPSLLDSMEIGEEFLPHALSWSIVDPALYRSFADLQSVIPILKKESDERRGSDPRFQAYVNLIARLGERQKTKEMSLNLNDRLDLARSEKQLQKLIENTDPKDGKEIGKNQDVVLDESMRVLVDFINLQRQNHQDSIAASDHATNKPAL